MIKMKGKDVAERLEADFKKDFDFLDEQQITPRLAIVRVGDDSSSVSYEKSAKKKMKELEIEVETFSYPAEIENEQFLKEFEKINEEDSIHGILLLRPLPEQIDLNKVTNMIHPFKDVDGMSPVNLGKIVRDDSTGLLPSTPAGVMEILDFYEIDLEGQDIVIIGHSEVVGKPLDILLLNKNATVTVCHIFTKNLKEKTKQADILISAVGKAGLVTANHLKEGAVVLDVGISFEDGKMTGDVDYEEASKKVRYITPVPGGVGVVTTTTLAKNVLKSARLLLAAEEI